MLPTFRRGARLGILTIALTAPLLADGTETLGTPSIAIEPGTDIIIAGVGLINGQPGIIDFDVPAGVTIKQAILYWEGFDTTETGQGDTDDIIVDNGGGPQGVTGTRIGGPTLFFTSPVDGWTSTYRYDATALVSNGPNAIAVSGLDFAFRNNGAGIIVIVDDGLNTASVSIRDGNDAAFVNFAGTLEVTAPQFFAVDPADFDRPFDVGLIVSSVSLEDPNGNPGRPTIIDIQAFEGASQVAHYELIDQLDNSDGDEWDSYSATDDGGFVLMLPAGADTVRVELKSEDADTDGDGNPVGDDNPLDGNLPASLVWNVGSLTVPGIPQDEDACRMTGGATILFGEGVSHGSGQAGAPTAQQPQPWGEWTHHQLTGPDGDFVFHAGTASAPDETEIDYITCSDPGWCDPARPAPAKQINFQGVGAFKNLRNASQNFADHVIVGSSLHWFTVHIEDLGEPGSSNNLPGNTGPCPEGGNEGQIADCDCPDFYRIAIHETSDPNSPVMYHVYNYIRSGNYQIHPEVGTH